MWQKGRNGTARSRTAIITSEPLYFFAQVLSLISCLRSVLLMPQPLFQIYHHFFPFSCTWSCDQKCWQPHLWPQKRVRAKEDESFPAGELGPWEGASQWVRERVYLLQNWGNSLERENQPLSTQNLKEYSQRSACI